jgi:hypothetical protein
MIKDHFFRKEISAKLLTLTARVLNYKYRR